MILIGKAYFKKITPVYLYCFFYYTRAIYVIKSKYTIPTFATWNSSGRFITRNQKIRRIHRPSGSRSFRA